MYFLSISWLPFTHSVLGKTSMMRQYYFTLVHDKTWNLCC